MLDAAGFRAAYVSRPLSDVVMEPVRKAISHMIESHSPYPAFVFDRHWAVVDANRTVAGCSPPSRSMSVTASSTSF